MKSTRNDLYLMKKTTQFTLALFCTIILLSCRKGEVPDVNSKYIGIWKNTSDTTNSYRVLIKPDGSGEYHEIKAGVSKDLLGYVYFDGYNFKIGSYRINKKFKADKIPYRITTSIQPYKYYTVATFNGIDYKNIEN